VRGRIDSRFWGCRLTNLRRRNLECDQSLYEDKSANQLSEGKMLFKSLSSSKCGLTIARLLSCTHSSSLPCPVACIELLLTTLRQQIERD